MLLSGTSKLIVDKINFLTYFPLISLKIRFFQGILAESSKISVRLPHEISLVTLEYCAGVIPKRSYVSLGSYELFLGFGKSWLHIRSF